MEIDGPVDFDPLRDFYHIHKLHFLSILWEHIVHSLASGSASRLLLELDCCCLPDIVTEDILVHKILLLRISSETNTLLAKEVLSNRIL